MATPATPPRTPDGSTASLQRHFSICSDMSTSARRLFEDDDSADDDGPLRTAAELELEVSLLQELVHALAGDAHSDAGSSASASSGMSMERALLHGGGIVALSAERARCKSPSFLRRPTFASDRRLSLSLASDLNASFSSDVTPLRRRQTLAPSAHPPRIAALTKENVSLLRAPRSRVSSRGSVSGSQASRTSVRTDGGAVFSRLYQPDYYKAREEKYKSMRDRQDSMNMSFAPRVNHHSSVCSRDSFASSSVRSARTDASGGVSSRLYDPEYAKKRDAKLKQMREARELRTCTFAPTTNAGGGALSSPVRKSVPARKS